MSWKSEREFQARRLDKLARVLGCPAGFDYDDLIEDEQLKRCAQTTCRAFKAGDGFLKIVVDCDLCHQQRFVSQKLNAARDAVDRLTNMVGTE